MNISARVSFRYRLAKRFQLPSLWYENEAGKRWLPDLSGDYPGDVPPGFIYQHSRFPTQLKHSILRTVTKEDVEKCHHPEGDLRKTYGWIDGVEGRECVQCGGTQIRNTGEPWPKEWESGRSVPIMEGSCGWSPDLALAMARPSTQEAQEAASRHGKPLRPMAIEDAIMVAAVACEACMNSLAHHYGLGWGYKRGSKDWEESGTQCELCETPDFWDWIEGMT